VPAGLALVGLALAIKARRWVDIVVSALVIAAFPVWLLALIFLIQFVQLPDNSFAP
jgi:ABC-type dipeptide/oligopeptide/nickel transport system permease component